MAVSPLLVEGVGKCHQLLHDVYLNGNIVGRRLEAGTAERAIPLHILTAGLPKVVYDDEGLLLVAQLHPSTRQIERAGRIVAGNIIGRNLFGSIAQHLFGLLIVTLADEFESQAGHDATMGVTHAHNSLVEIDTLLVDASELEAVHDVVVGALRIEILHASDGLAAIGGGEGRDAICQALGNGVVAQIDVVILSHGDSDIDRTGPVTLCEHLENHQVTLVKGVLARERDGHAVGNRVGSHHHATLAHSILVDGHIDGIGGNEVQVLILGTYPVFQDILQLEGIVAKLLAGLLRILTIVLKDSLLHAGFNGDILVGASTILNTLPGDGDGRRIVGRTAHLVDIPVGLQIREVADTGIGTYALHILIIPEREGVVIAIGIDDGVTLVLQRHQVVLTEVTTGVTTATVVVIPRLRSHLNGNQQTKHGHHGSKD